MPRSFSDAIDMAIIHLQTLGESDLFTSQPETEFLLKNPALTRHYLNEIDQLVLKKSEISFLPPTTDLFSLGPFHYRQGTLIDPLLNFYATTILIQLSPKIEKCRIARTKKRVFSYRISRKIKSNWFSQDVGWTEFNKANLENANDFAFTAIADISQFYSSIRPEHLMQPFFEKIFGEKDRNRLSGIFHYLNIASKGLPVGGSFSRILAEAMLSPIDAEMELKRVNFTRFVDDIRIFANSEQELRMNLYFLTQRLILRGLYLNRHKIRVIEGCHYAQELMFERPPFQIKIFNNKLSNPKIEKPFFDPYSELVVGRAEDLKKISGVTSISDAMICELEKSLPDQLAIKILISALNYAPITDCYKTINLLLSQIYRAELSPLALRTVNMLKQKKNDLSASEKERLKQNIEDTLQSCAETLPDSAVAILLFGLLILEQRCSAELIDLLVTRLSSQNYSTYLGRQITFILIQQGYTKELKLHLKMLKQKNNKDTSVQPWLELAQRSGHCFFGDNQKRPYHSHAKSAPHYLIEKCFNASTLTASQNN